MNIEICIHTYFYQKRLCWMLSSLLQQAGNKPEIIINISHTENDGNPTTKDVCYFFKQKGLNIDEIFIPQEEIGNRSKARVKQMEETKADWILFADSDMVYDPLFFSDLKAQLENGLKKEEKCMGADRVSLDIEYCTNYFNEDKRIYPMVVDNVKDIVDKWPVYYISGKTRAAGYFQLANVSLAKERNIKYGEAKADSLRRYRADRYFRNNLGGICPIITKNQYHLNHLRSDSVFQN